MGKKKSLFLLFSFDSSLFVTRGNSSIFNSSSKVNGNGESEIMLRLSVSRDLRLRLKSGIFVEPSRFREGKFIMPRADRKTLANFNWCVKRGYITRTPFASCTSICAEKYGTPYYISIEERDTIADHDFYNKPALAVQRDNFIFQCLIGCRVSDLIEMTPKSMINGAVEYMPNKTKGERPEVIRVPFNKRAVALVEKYKV